jgi:hypothetical protein
LFIRNQKNLLGEAPDIPEIIIIFLRFIQLFIIN